MSQDRVTRAFQPDLDHHNSHLDHDIIEFADVQAESPGATDEEQEPPTDPGGTNAREDEVMKIIL